MVDLTPGHLLCSADVPLRPARLDLSSPFPILPFRSDKMSPALPSPCPLQHATAEALRCLSQIISSEAAGSRRWTQLVQALAAVESIEDMASPRSGEPGSAAPAPSPLPPVPRPERPSLVYPLAVSRMPPERMPRPPGAANV